MFLAGRGPFEISKFNKKFFEVSFIKLIIAIISFKVEDVIELNKKPERHDVIVMNLLIGQGR